MEWTNHANDLGKRTSVRPKMKKGRMSHFRTFVLCFIFSLFQSGKTRRPFFSPFLLYLLLITEWIRAGAPGKFGFLGLLNYFSDNLHGIVEF